MVLFEVGGYWDTAQTGRAVMSMRVRLSAVSAVSMVMVVVCVMGGDE